jgi:thiosulfate reductase cytochrome b subunit
MEKHPLAIRWLHWVYFPVLSIMIWSGFIIYWADSSVGYTNEHQVYRIGFGSFTLIRLFPAWFNHLFRFDSHEARGLAFHALFMWIFAINGLLYVLFLAISGQWRFILPDRESLAQLTSTLRSELTGHHAPHHGHKYNEAQRVAYTLVILMGAGALLTGIAIWKPTSLHQVTTLFGGYETARWLHFWLTIGFCLFFFVHVIQVLRAGWNNLRSMITGAQIVPIDEPGITQSPRQEVHPHD